MSTITEEVVNEKQSDFDVWWMDTYADSLSNWADYGFGEEVWNASTKHTWNQVFQVLDDYPNDIPREAVRQLEELRNRAGAGLDV